jgi:hypothetical protein
LAACSSPALVARPWRLDPDDFLEVLRLFADAPGFLATLPHTFEGQPQGLNEIDVPVRILLHYLKGLGHTPMSDDPELLAELVATTSRAPRAEAPA